MNKKPKRNKRYLKENSKTPYNSGNVAYELEPDYYPPKKEQPLPAQRPAPRKKRDIAKEHRSNTLHKIKTIIAVGIVFASSIAIMGSNAILEKQRVVVSQLKDELAAIENDNLTLQAEIAEQIDMEYIEKEATTRLGMTEPKSYQVVSIDVPKESYTMQYDVEQTEEDTGFSFSKIMDLFKKD